MLIKEISDPRLKMVTITNVKLTSDLRIARIYFTLMENEKSVDDVKAGFKSAHGYIKRVLARRLGLRYMPNIEFYYDDSYNYASHINKLLKSIQEDNEENITSHLPE